MEAGGLPNLRARTLAEEAGCALGAIYGVFPDLHALILAVNARTLDDLAAALRDGADPTNPGAELCRLGAAYLRFATDHRQRWRALFQHRLPPGQDVPPAYADRLRQAFAVVEAPLARLRPGDDDATRALLARSLFSAVHGVVDLGLDEKVAALPPGVLAAQVELVLRALAAGLAADPATA